jgi:hypothetical protein
MLFFFLTPWVVFSLFTASPLPNVFGVRSSNVRGEVGETLFLKIFVLTGGPRAPHALTSKGGHFCVMSGL